MPRGQKPFTSKHACAMPYIFAMIKAGSSHHTDVRKRPASPVQCGLLQKNIICGSFACQFGIQIGNGFCMWYQSIFFPNRLRAYKI